MRVIHCYFTCLEPGAKTDINTARSQSSPGSFIHSRLPLTSFLFLASSFLTPLVPHFMIVSAPVRKERDSLLDSPLKCLRPIILTLVSCKPIVVAELLNDTVSNSVIKFESFS